MVKLLSEQKIKCKPCRFLSEQKIFPVLLGYLNHILLCQDPNTPPFSVPLVPWLPATSVLINILLTTKLSWETWVRFSVWMAAGTVINLVDVAWKTQNRFKISIPCSGNQDRQKHLIK